VSVQVVQRRGAGIVRGIAAAPLDALPRGSTVLNSGHHARAPFNATEFERTVRLLAGRTSTAEAPAKLLETGIKVIDVMCPLVAGGTVAIAGDLGAGITVVMEELVRRLSGGTEPLSIFILMPPPSPESPYALKPGFSHAEELRKEGYSEGTVGAVQTFFLRAEDGPWTAERVAALAPVDVVIRLSRERAQAKVYPTVDGLASRSRLLKTKAADDEHATIAERVRHALASLWAKPGEAESCDDRLLLERAHLPPNPRRRTRRRAGCSILFQRRYGGDQGKWRPRARLRPSQAARVPAGDACRMIGHRDRRRRVGTAPWRWYFVKRLTRCFEEAAGPMSGRFRFYGSIIFIGSIHFIGSILGADAARHYA
ncbi:MAG TPA: hypothetical protein VMR17_11375, partial [Xanthobacteraceae bacterium]|nr:hypothetical protein [Xanthobacteraceae bacterium]